MGIFVYFFALQTAYATASHEKIIHDLGALYATNDIAISIVINEIDTSIAASADFDGKTYKVIVNRALLNSPRLSDDGLRVILCHEVGHLMGGAPRRNAPPEWGGTLAPDGLSWMSSEGQADYYATSTCFRKLAERTNHKTSNPPPTVVQMCKTQWITESEVSICIRATLGAKNFLNLLFDFPISFETPSQDETDITLIDEYPSRQCRLDTLFAGALCPDNQPLKFNLMNPQAQNCSVAVGLRPRCWYSP